MLKPTVSAGLAAIGAIGMMGLYGCGSSSESNNSATATKITELGAVESSETATPLILAVNFSDNPLGQYVFSDLAADFVETDNWSDGLDEGRVAIASDAGSNRMRINYPGGQFGTEETGAQFKVKTAPRERLCVSYKLQLKDGFQHGKGGKLPGLAGGVANTGSKSNTPNGRDGYSSRIMWREGGVLYQYSYLFAVEEGGSPVSQHYMQWQLPAGGDVILSAGETHQIETCATMNSVTEGVANVDGKLQSWFNGERVLDASVAYRNDTDLQSNILYFSTFFGGGDASWNSPQDQTIDYWDIKLSSEPITANEE